MKDTDLTCGMVIKSAREEKEKTINDLAFEIAKNKEDVKEYEKKIKQWENDKAYPSLEEIYLLAYALEINPTDLMILRDRHRKTLAKSSKKKKASKIDYDELTEHLYYVAATLGKIVGFIGIIVFAVVCARLVKVSIDGDSTPDEFANAVGNVITDYMDNTYNSVNTINSTNLVDSENLVDSNNTNYLIDGNSINEP